MEVEMDKEKICQILVGMSNSKIACSIHRNILYVKSLIARYGDRIIIDYIDEITIEGAIVTITSNVGTWLGDHEITMNFANGHVMYV